MNKETIMIKLSEVHQFLSNESLNQFNDDLKGLLGKLKEENAESGFILQCDVNREQNIMI